MRIAVVGYGYWGPNVVRNFSRIPEASVSWVADINAQTLLEIPKIYPTVRTTSDIADIARDQMTEAVVIVTPPATHFQMASYFLKAGKHILVEKPMTQTEKDARTLVRLAKKYGKILMVDHTFIYTPAVVKLHEIIKSNVLGNIYSIDSVRTNLGLIQKDSNVIYDLAVHDFAIIDYLFGHLPETVTVNGFMQKEIKQASVAHITALYPTNLFVHAHVSWLSPIKIRRMIFIGTKKMLVYDDIESTEKIKIYDKGVSFIHDPKQYLHLRVGYRSGDVVAPDIPIEEGLFGMAKEFVTCIATGKQPITDGRAGLRVVRCLEKATASVRTGGKTIIV